MKDNIVPGARDGIGRGQAMKLGGGVVFLLFGATLLCFCSLLPAALFLSFLFNGLWLGSRLFATMAQEREKRTIDALRLTQLSSLDILYLKSRSELLTWARGNVLLLGLMIAAGLMAGDSAPWVLSGGLAMAAGGLLSIALALGVSTRSETTSTAVVSGWVSKGAWLVGLPLLDKVLEAVFVLDGPVHFASYLDPAWIAYHVGQASFFELNGLPIVGLWLGTLATVGAAGMGVLWSARLIDSSFENAANLEDRTRHAAYSQTFPCGLSANPFFIRELAWQLRSGAGRWPGYAVFLTLFLAPFLYGLAQNQKGHDVQEIKVVRQDILPVAQPAPFFSSKIEPLKFQGNPDEALPSKEAPDWSPMPRRHNHICLSKMMGLPVYHAGSYRPTYPESSRTIVTATGKVEQVSLETFEQFQSAQKRPGTTASAFNDLAAGPGSMLEYELGRGLLSGLLLTIIYLFVRGGAFMAGSVTGEKERRAWDQIALTGVTPQTYISGKLAAVLAFPMRQMLMASPVLGLFALFGVITPLQLVLVMGLLVSSFAAASTLGIAASTLRPTSHEAQGTALVFSAALLVMPMTTTGSSLLGALLAGLVFKTSMSGLMKVRLLTGGLLGIVIAGCAMTPLASIMTMCGSTYGHSSLIWDVFGVSGMLLASTAWMAGLACLFYQVALSGLEDGGSVRA